MNSRIIRVFEHETLGLKPNLRGEILTEYELLRLYQFNDQNNNNYFTGVRNGIKFKNYVGVIQIGNLTLEILPKADKSVATVENLGNWQKVLLEMLKFCNKISVHSVSEASLKKNNHSLLDLYFEIYLQEIERLLRLGLVKKYHKKQGNVPALKGRLLFSKNISQNLVHQERFYTEHQTFDFEHLLNQILLKGLYVLNSIVRSPIFKDKIARLLNLFPDITELEIKKTHFDQLKLNRKTLIYSEALKIAEMLILNYSPSLKTGDKNMLALLFDMNKLWEEYIYKMLLKSISNDVKVYSQDSQKFWNSKTIRPDIILEYPDKKVVIDTKWKIMDSCGPSDEDLKQMFAYNLYWGSIYSMLLYPKVDVISDTYGNFHKGQNTAHGCKLGFINILNENRGLNFNIGQEILNKLES